MPSLADVVQQMGPSITYDERTKRFHDMEQNYRMVSTRGIVAGGLTRTDGRGSSGYVTQEAFNSFRSEIYLYISKVASFTREALVEMQKTMAGEQKDTEALRNDERRAAEEKRERRKELISGALTRASTGIRQATGMGPLGALFTGLFTGLTAVLANVNVERLRETFNNIGAVFDNVRSFFDKLKEYSTLIAAIGAALAAMVAANMLNRIMPQRGGGSAPRGGSTPPPSSGSGPRPTTGGAAAGAAGAGAGAAGAGAAGRQPTPPQPAPQQPQVKPGYRATETPSGTRYRSEKTGRYVKPSEALATPGEPTRQPRSGQPEQDRPAGKSNRLRLGRFLGALGPIIEVFNARQQLQALSEQRDAETIDENAYKDEVIRTIAGAAGAIVGGAAGGLLGSLLGPGGALIGGFIGSMGGAQLGEYLATTGLGRRIGEVIYDRFFVERPTGQPEAQLMGQLTELQRQRRERTASIDEMTQITDRAVAEGRITRSQARQLEEVGSQEGTNLRIGDIEAAIEQLQVSGLEGAGSRLQPVRQQGTGRVIVLPTMYQEVVTQRPAQPAATPAAEVSSEIQTRTPDPTLGQASQAATFSGGQRGGLIDRARARNAR